MIYHCIYNENLLFTPSSSSSSLSSSFGSNNNHYDHHEATPLTIPILQQVTYDLSYQYGTANKAPRLPAILQYSNRLNNVALSYIHVLCDRNDNEQLVLNNELNIYHRRNNQNDGHILHTTSYCTMNIDNTTTTTEPKLTIPFHPHYSG